MNPVKIFLSRINIISLILILLLLLPNASHGAHDYTYRPGARGPEVVEAVLDVLQQACVFASSDRGMMRTIAVLESNDGTDEDTYTEYTAHHVEGHVKGIWGVTMEMLSVVKERTDLEPAIIAASNISVSELDNSAMRIPLYNGLVARVYIDTLYKQASEASGWSMEIPWNTDGQAMFWTNSYHNISEGKKYQDYINATLKLQKACPLRQAEIVFVVDESASLTREKFISMMDVMSNMMEAFHMGDEMVRVGMVLFSAKPKIEFELTDVQNKSSFDAIKSSIAHSYQRVRLSLPNTGRGLGTARYILKTQSRPAIPRIAVVMTTGVSAAPWATRKAASMLHSDGVHVFAVGIGTDVHEEELMDIGSEPDCIHVHNIASFLDLEAFTHTLKREVCKSPAELEVGVTYTLNGSIAAGERLYYHAKINETGATLKLAVSYGGITIDVSYTARNPGPAIYDLTEEITVANLLGSDYNELTVGTLFIPYKSKENIINEPINEDGEADGEAEAIGKSTEESEEEDDIYWYDNYRDYFEGTTTEKNKASRSKTVEQEVININVDEAPEKEQEPQELPPEPIEVFIALQGTGERDNEFKSIALLAGGMSSGERVSATVYCFIGVLVTIVTYV